MTDKKQENIKEGLDEYKVKCEEYLAGWKHAQADLINYKKDEVKRLGEFVKFANENIVLELIGLFDEARLALGYAPAELKNNAKWSEGIENLMKKFDDLLAKHGVKKIKAEGENFDPLRHESVGMSDSKEQSGKVVEEVQAGYEMHGKIIRPARVKISK